MAHAVSASANVTDEQFAARDMVRSWAAASKSIDAVRTIEQGDPDAWRAPYRGLAQLGTFGVAIPEEFGGAGGSVEDLCLMVDEAAAALVPGPVATTALATLVITDETLLEALASGERTAGVALSSDISYDSAPLRASPSSSSARSADGLLLPAGRQLGPAGRRGGRRRTVEPLKATDFSRPLARVHAGRHAPAAPQTRRRSARATWPRPCWRPRPPAWRAGAATAVEYAKVREQFGQQIGGFQAIKHLCAEMLRDRRVGRPRRRGTRPRAADRRRASSGRSPPTSRPRCGFDGAVEVAKDCIQVLGGIGFTYEHDAHLYLRRALALRALVGGGDAAAARLDRLARSAAYAGGVRRRPRRPRRADPRPRSRPTVERIAALPEGERRAGAGRDRATWRRTGRRRTGSAPTPSTQLVIDQELAAAGRRPARTS